MGFTSAMAVWIGSRRSARARGGLWPAILRACELAGLAAAFLVLNLVTGVVAVLLLRRVTGGFVSMYVNTDLTLVALSVLQAAVWQWWRSDGSTAADVHAHEDAPDDR